MRALSLPGCGCRMAFHFNALLRLVAAGERFDLVAGASSGSLVGAAYVSGRLAEGPGILREMGGTPVLSPRWLRSQRSPFGMSAIVRGALERHLPAAELRAATTPLFVSTTPLSALPAQLVSGLERAAVHDLRAAYDPHELLLASCTFPPFYARIPRLAGAAHLDGGIADNTLIEVLVARGATDIVVITPHADGRIYRGLRRGFEPPHVPSRVRLRVVSPARPLALRSFDFDPARLREALEVSPVVHERQPGAAGAATS